MGIVGVEIAVNTVEEGRQIRNSPEFAPEGTNANFVQAKDNYLNIRTYERGVEAETLSCGTGTVASAIAASIENGLTQTNFACQVLGGKLRVSFEIDTKGGFRNIFLEGPAHEVFEGAISV